MAVARVPFLVGQYFLDGVFLGGKRSPSLMSTISTCLQDFPSLFFDFIADSVIHIASAKIVCVSSACVDSLKQKKAFAKSQKLH